MLSPAFVDEDSPLDNELRSLVSKSSTLYEKVVSTKISTANEKMFGKCASCKHFMFAESEFSIWYARCNGFGVKLSHKDPIVNCSSYTEVGSMSLWEMKEMATLIEGKKSRAAGFITPHE